MSELARLESVLCQLANETLPANVLVVLQNT